ncbi:hypothetical protein E2320_014225, partial [Naja naja]
MIPEDWKQVFRMILTSMQYVVWESEYLRHAQAAALGAVPAQKVFPQATLAVVSECAYQAFLKVPQAGEPADCKRAVQLFSDQPINLIVDTQYVYLAMQSLPYSYCALHLGVNLLALFLSLKNRLEKRSHPIYIEHIRSHTPFDHALTGG